jgi:hypothetical protein
MLAWQHELEAVGMYDNVYTKRRTELDMAFQQATTPKPQWLLDSQPDTLVLFPTVINKYNSPYIYNILCSKLDNHGNSRMLMMLWLHLPNITAIMQFKYCKKLLDKIR